MSIWDYNDDFDTGHQFEGFDPVQQVADNPSGTAAPKMPQAPGGYTPGDVSGFANYGMTAPSINVAMVPPGMGELPTAPGLPNPQTQVGAGAQSRPQGIMDLSQALPGPQGMIPQRYGQAHLGPLPGMRQAQQAQQAPQIPNQSMRLPGLMAMAAVTKPAREARAQQQQQPENEVAGRLRSYLMELSRS